MTQAPTHRVLGAELRPGDLLIGRAQGGAQADLSDVAPRQPCGTVASLGEPYHCCLTDSEAQTAQLFGGWTSTIRIDTDTYYDVRRA